MGFRPNGRDPGVELAHYIDDHPGCGVNLHCAECGKSKRFEMGDVVERLEARGIEPRSFGICAIAELIDCPCQCGAMKWSTAPDFVLPKMGLQG